MHSYNYKRWDREVPLFNIGAENVPKEHMPIVEQWRDELSKIQLTGIENVAAINDVFYGRGYNLEFIYSHFKNTIVLATEIKKTFCNELTSESFPKIIKELQLQIKEAILNQTNEFAKKKYQLVFKNHDESARQASGS